MRNKYTFIVGNLTSRIKRGANLINKEFHILFKKDKIQQYLENKRKKYFLMIKHLEEIKQKKIQSEINKQKRIKIRKKITKSISNNNMLLNIMTQDKQFQKYLDSQKQSRNNNFSIKNFSEKPTTNSSSIKTKKSNSNLFMTEVPKFNNTLIKTKKNILKIFRNKIFKSNLNLKSINNEKPQKKNLIMKLNCFSANNLFNSKRSLSYNKEKVTKKRRVYFNVWNSNKIRSNLIK